MAIINGLYIHVTSEVAIKDVETTTHPVESGIPLTDTVKPTAYSLSLSGKIVDYGNTKASEVLSALYKLRDTGSLIDYRGRNVASSLQIKDFSTTHKSTNHGGADFNMELRQVRIAKSSYVPKPQGEKDKESAAKNDTASIKVGSIVVFKGGSVYVSSDAQKAAATRSRSTCKVTIISTASWSVHKYHLISTDGKMVYGWVDLANIECSQQTGTSGTTNAGTQQVKNGSGTAVYHTVKSGDTIWGLLNNSYKDLNTSCQWVIDNNPSAFSRAGDARTLQVGAKLLLGYR